ncbi:hypothetical protein F5Y16DRAFT_396871 [Xylariaceae sp. FL0255]|nr:hypothetical protein F5Y16DRAFT_396871 [Xylariaceae sp. FL0255]
MPPKKKGTGGKATKKDVAPAKGDLTRKELEAIALVWEYMKDEPELRNKTPLSAYILTELRQIVWDELAQKLKVTDLRSAQNLVISAKDKLFVLAGNAYDNETEEQVARQFGIRDQLEEDLGERKERNEKKKAAKVAEEAKVAAKNAADPGSEKDGPVGDPMEIDEPALGEDAMDLDTPKKATSNIKLPTKPPGKRPLPTKKETPKVDANALDVTDDDDQDDSDCDYFMDDASEKSDSDFDYKPKAKRQKRNA